MQAQEDFEEPYIRGVYPGSRLAVSTLIHIATESAKDLSTVSKVCVASLVDGAYLLQADGKHTGDQDHPCLLPTVIEQTRRLQVMIALL